MFFFFVTSELIAESQHNMTGIAIIVHIHILSSVSQFDIYISLHRIEYIISF